MILIMVFLFDYLKVKLNEYHMIIFINIIIIMVLLNIIIHQIQFHHH